MPFIKSSWRTFIHCSHLHHQASEGAIRLIKEDIPFLNPWSVSCPAHDWCCFQDWLLYHLPRGPRWGQSTCSYPDSPFGPSWQEWMTYFSSSGTCPNDQDSCLKDFWEPPLSLSSDNFEEYLWFWFNTCRLLIPLFQGSCNSSVESNLHFHFFRNKLFYCSTSQPVE